MRTNFFDTTTKYQINIPKVDPTNIMIKKNHREDKVKKITFKTQKGLLADDTDEKIRESGLL